MKRRRKIKPRSVPGVVAPMAGASGIWCWRCGQSYTPPNTGDHACYCPGCKK